MRGISIAGLAFLLAAATSLAAEPEAPAEKPEPALVLEQPTSTDECLSTMDKVLERALHADLLDDQIEEAETELAKMEDHCLDQRFAEALEAAKAVAKILASNK